MPAHDDLALFAEHGLDLPPGGTDGRLEREGARIWFSSFGSGPAVILLHGGMGHSGNFANQVPPLLEQGFRVVVIDSRGHGRSTRDPRPYTYELMADDVLAVMHELGLGQAAFVGWSDGACVSLVLAAAHPERASGVYFFACNMDPSGAKKITEFPLTLQRCYARHTADYQRLSATPEQWEVLGQDLGLMQRTQPNYSVSDLAAIRVPVAVVLGESDEFIHREHAEHLAHHIPGAALTILPGVSHFAPIQRPEVFNASVLEFLASTSQTNRP